MKSSVCEAAVLESGHGSDCNDAAGVAQLFWEAVDALNHGRRH
jgi:hypothetical protein